MPSKHAKKCLGTVLQFLLAKFGPTHLPDLIAWLIGYRPDGDEPCRPLSKPSIGWGFLCGTALTHNVLVTPHAGLRLCGPYLGSGACKRKVTGQRVSVGGPYKTGSDQPRAVRSTATTRLLSSRARHDPHRAICNSLNYRFAHRYESRKL